MHSLCQARDGQLEKFNPTTKVRTASSANRDGKLLTKWASQALCTKMDHLVKYLHSVGRSNDSQINAKKTSQKPQSQAETPV